MNGGKTFGPQFIRGDAKFHVYVGEKPESKFNSNNFPLSSKNHSNNLLSMMEVSEKKVNLGSFRQLIPF